MKSALSRKPTERREKRKVNNGPASRRLLGRIFRKKNRFGLPSQKEGGSYSKLFSQRLHMGGVAIARGSLCEQIREFINVRENDSIHLSIPAFHDPIFQIPERRDLVIMDVYSPAAVKENRIIGHRYFPVLKSKNPDLFEAIVNYVRKRQ